jgi:hypothetical protein
MTRNVVTRRFFRLVVVPPPPVNMATKFSGINNSDKNDDDEASQNHPATAATTTLLLLLLLPQTDPIMFVVVVVREFICTEKVKPREREPCRTSFRFFLSNRVWSHGRRRCRCHHQAAAHLFSSNSNTPNKQMMGQEPPTAGPTMLRPFHK